MRVRKGSTYIFDPCGWDIYDAKEYTPKKGDKVKVCQPYGCPRNNTMNHCYVETMEGKFLGLVHCNSLTKEGL